MTVRHHRPEQRSTRQGRGRPAKGSTLPTLADLDLTRQQAHEWRKLASIPDDVFEAAIVEAKDRGRLTQEAVLRLAGIGREYVRVTDIYRCVHCGGANEVAP